MLFRLLVLLHHCILCTQITGKKKMLQVKIASNHFKSIQKPQSFTTMGIRQGLRGTTKFIAIGLYRFRGHIALEVGN